MIKTYSIDDPEWDKLVKSFADHDVYHLAGYVRAFKLAGDGEPQLVYFENDSTRALNVIMLRDISHCERFEGLIDEGQYFDAATPYGYGGFLIDGDDLDSLRDEYRDYCRRRGIISEFVRFHPVLANAELLKGFYDVVELGDTVCIDISRTEGIWANFSSKNRNVIRKAQKAGLQVGWCRSREIIAPFMEMYNETMRRDGASDYYFFERPFYESILDDLKYNALWFYAEKDGELAAMAIFLFINGGMHYHLSASRKDMQRYAPTNLLIYEAALWGAENGQQTLHLGGGVGSGHDGLYKFKKSFYRGEDRRFCIGKKIYDEEKYQYLMDLRHDADEGFSGEGGFFPAYRGN